MSGFELKQRVEAIRQKVEERGLGEVLGRVSPGEVASVGADERRVVIDVDFDTYLRVGARIGEYLGVATILGSVMLGRVVEVRRRHVAHIAHIQTLYAPVEDLEGLKTPAQIVLEPLTECPIDALDCEPTPVYTPVDPLSVVFRPSPEFRAKMLGLPREGILLGMLYAGGFELSVEVRLPERAMYQHVLVVGTTGAGKTVLLKNMALSAIYTVRNATVLALDLQGDYLLTVLPPEAPGVYQPLDQITVLMPVTRHLIDRRREDIQRIAARILGEEYTLLDVTDEREAAGLVGRALAELFVEKTYPGAEILDAEVTTEGVQVAEVRAKVEAGGRVFTLRLLPWAMRFEEVYPEIPQFFPFFSERVSMLFRRLVDALAGEGQRDIDTVMKRLDAETTYDAEKGGVWRKLKLHPSQLANFVRGMNMIYETGLFDVSYAVAENKSQRVFATFGEPNYMGLSGLVVADLREFREAPSVASAVVYRVLSRLFEARDEELARGASPSPTFIFIDEAHYYFPQEGAREDFNKEVVEAVINKLTRLGRVRKMGVVFATHSPADLNDLVIQLTNTKIAMRSEPKVLERVDMAEYAGELAYAQSGVAVAKSFIYRTHAVTFKTLPPQTRHRGV
ncbi:MAG: ATP-binding protein [Pyrobaculum sp.]|jgi:DNA helicase HerA-like ATPase